MDSGAPDLMRKTDPEVPEKVRKSEEGWVLATPSDAQEHKAY